MDKELRNEKIIEEYLNGKSTCKLAEEYNLCRSTISKILKKNNIKVRNNKINSRKYYHNENFFEVIDTEEKAYWLGFIYADGYITINKGQYNFGISLSINDKEHLEKFKKSLNATNPINTYNGNGYTNNEYCRLLITSEKTVKDLIDKGVVLRKTNVLTFPSEQQVPKHLIHHFIRGYFDGDGCITSSMSNGYERYEVKFVGTYNMLDKINNIINDNCNIKISKLFKRKEYQEVFSLQYSSNKRSKVLYNYMYKNATIYLQRKFNKFSRLMKK